MKRFYKILILTTALFLALFLNLFSDTTAYADTLTSNNIPTLIECPPPPGQGGNYPSTSNPTVEIGETFTIDDYVYIPGPPADLEVITIEPESLIEAVDISNNQYRAVSPGKVEIELSYRGQYNCSGGTISFSGSLQVNVIIPGPIIARIYLPLIYD